MVLLLGEPAREDADFLDLQDHRTAILRLLVPILLPDSKDFLHEGQSLEHGRVAELEGRLVEQERQAVGPLEDGAEQSSIKDVVLVTASILFIILLATHQDGRILFVQVAEHGGVSGEYDGQQAKV